MEPLEIEIETRGLSKSFAGRVALDDVTLRVATGELCGVVGADGAGKTTLLRCIAGLYRPDRGDVMPGRRGRARVGLCPQGFHLYADLTVDENLTFFGSIHGLESVTLRDRGEELLRFASLEEHRGRLAGSLSGGMQQKLTLICSVLHRPPILVLDEPTTGVDPVSRREFWHLLDALHRDGTTILLASAYVDEVERCDHVLFLHEGRLLVDGTLDELVPAGDTLDAVLRRRMSRVSPAERGSIG